jgi:hypothetical protein
VPHFPEEQNLRRLSGPQAVLRILRTGPHWQILPRSYPYYKTLHRRFERWREKEVICAAPTELATVPPEEGSIDELDCYIDPMFAPAKGGCECCRRKNVRIMAVIERHGVPLAVTTHAANHHEVRLVQLTFDFYMVGAKPANLIGEKCTTAIRSTQRRRRAIADAGTSADGSSSASLHGFGINVGRKQIGLNRSAWDHSGKHCLSPCAVRGWASPVSPRSCVTRDRHRYLAWADPFGRWKLRMMSGSTCLVRVNIHGRSF